MALAIDATNIGSQDSGASFTINHTCAASCTLLRVAVTVPAGVTITASSSVDGSMTSHGSIENGSAAKVEIFRLISPTVGAHVITITPNSSVVAAARSISFTGGDTTTPLGTSYTSAINTSTPSVTVIDSASGDIVIDDWAYTAGGQSPTPGGGQTEDTFSTNGNFDIRLRGSHESATGASTVASWTTTSAIDIAMIATAVKAAGGGGGGGITAAQGRNSFELSNLLG